ncbi:MAG: hypothetical protein ACTS3R_06660 [Inquilinaceae bacterium]
MASTIAPEFESLFAKKGTAAPADPTSEKRTTVSPLTHRLDAPDSTLRIEASSDGQTSSGEEGTPQASLFDVVLESRDRPWDEWLRRDDAPSPSAVGEAGGATPSIAPVPPPAKAVPSEPVTDAGNKPQGSDSAPAPLPFAVPKKETRSQTATPAYSSPTSRLTFETVEPRPATHLRLARRRQPSKTLILAAVAIALTGTWVVSQTGLIDRLAGGSGVAPEPTPTTVEQGDGGATVANVAPEPALSLDPPPADATAEQATDTRPAGDPVVGLVPTLLSGSESSTSPSIDLVRIADDGAAVLAGRAPANSNLIILDNGEPIGYVTADDRGDWIFEPDYAMSPDGHEFSLAVRSETGGVSVPSQRSTPSGDAAEGPEEQGSADVRDQPLVPSSDTVPLPVRKPQ